MPFEVTLNMNSVMLIREELDNSLNKAIQYAEAFLAEGSDPELLGKSITELHQVSGILRVVEFGGAIELSNALLGVCQALGESKLTLNENGITQLGQGLYSLRRYIDYSINHKCAYPLTLSTPINQLNALARQAIITEASLVHFVPPQSASLAPPLEHVLAADDLAKVKRLAHMYQVGLLGALKGQNINTNAHLMQRAVDRMKSGHAAIASEEWWVLVTGLLAVIRSGDLELNFTRKRLLASIDAYFRKRLKATSADAMTLSDAHRDEMVYLVQLAGDVPAAEQVRELYGIPQSLFDDKKLRELVQALAGPGRDVLNTMATAIREELHQVKEMLEIYSTGMGMIDKEDVGGRLRKIGDILGVSGFNRLKGLLQDHGSRFGDSIDADDLNKDAIQGLADAMLLVESTLADPDRFTDQALGDNDHGSEAVALSMLEEATGVVINECKNSIVLAKRGITAYMESNFDPGHVANVGATLGMVRGAMVILNYGRAARVMENCMRYVEDSWQNNVDDQQIRNTIETLADALISIEYYLDELSISEKENTELLAVAEESLSELGFAA